MVHNVSVFSFFIAAIRNGKTFFDPRRRKMLLTKSNAILKVANLIKSVL